MFARLGEWRKLGWKKKCMKFSRSLYKRNFIIGAFILCHFSQRVSLRSSTSFQASPTIFNEILFVRKLNFYVIETEKKIWIFNDNYVCQKRVLTFHRGNFDDEFTRRNYFAIVSAYVTRITRFTHIFRLHCSLSRIRDHRVSAILALSTHASHTRDTIDG